MALCGGAWEGRVQSRMGQSKVAFGLMGSHEIGWLWQDVTGHSRP